MNERIRTMIGHWRALTPTQEAAVRTGRASGATVAQLAVRFGVTRRTIYRVLERSQYETREVVIFDRRAIFQLVDDQPVQVTPWVAV